MPNRSWSSTKRARRARCRRYPFCSGGWSVRCSLASDSFLHRNCEGQSRMHWDSDSIALALASAVAASLVRAGDARADGSAADSSYGRVDGDVALVGGAGAVATGRGVRAEVELRLRYLESAGVYVTYEDAVAVGSAADPQRVLCTGLELRPLFLLRWLRGNETQRARLDLALDSIGLEMGATFHQ